MLVAVVVAGLLSSCGVRRKYENPIAKDTLQPDKILFDKAIGDLERGRYDVARLTLQTLISTYDKRRPSNCPTYPPTKPPRVAPIDQYINAVALYPGLAGPAT